MTKASDNIFPKLTLVEGAAPVSPAATDFSLYFDSSDHLLKWKNSAGTVTTVATGASSFSDPMTTRGDVIVRNASNVTARLGIGTTGKVLQSDGTDISWQTPAAGGGGPALTDPTGLSWSWVNQGSSPAASITTVGATLVLDCAQEGSDNWHMRVKSLAYSKPYTVTAHFQCPQWPYGNYAAVGMGWLQSSNNRFAGANWIWNNGPRMSSSVSTSNYVVTGNYVDPAYQGQFWPWIKLHDDATSRKIWTSIDGISWHLADTVATNTDLTPDRLYFGVNPRNGTYGQTLILDSWEEVNS